MIYFSCINGHTHEANLTTLSEHSKVNMELRWRCRRILKDGCCGAKSDMSTLVINDEWRKPE